ncbi:MAG TPA: methyltransferase domain-containing protein [Solirubrobacteraceae bacterium]
MTDEGVRERWNARHRDADISEPAEWVLSHRRVLEARLPGRALDVACGLGRHAVFLAELGFHVDAVDISDVAVARVRAVADDRRLPIVAMRADLTGDPDLPADAYRVIVNTYFLERSLFPHLEAVLAPGGIVVFETFTREQASLPSGPSDERLLLADDELLNAFPRLRVVEYRQAVVVAGERPRAVASLLAERVAGTPSIPATADMA